MSDLIRREDAIKALHDEWDECLVVDESGEYIADICENVIDTIPSADRPQEWIPCSERLPREEEQDDELGVLVTLGNGYSGLQYDWYHDGRWYDWNGFVVAWMPLPERYKERKKHERHDI